MSDLVAQFLGGMVNAMAVAIVSIGISAIAVLFNLWLDVRSIKKAQGSAFKKVRDLEKKVFGSVTSELDSRE